jgi:hypothetical protein
VNEVPRDSSAPQERATGSSYPLWRRIGKASVRIGPIGVPQFVDCHNASEPAATTNSYPLSFSTISRQQSHDFRAFCQHLGLYSKRILNRTCSPSVHEPSFLLIFTMADKEFTYSDVSEHNTKKDLYMVVHDKVYDATSFVDEHPYVAPFSALARYTSAPLGLLSRATPP